MVIAASVSVADDAPIRHAELGIEFSVPSGYEDLKAGAGEPDLVFAFGRPNAEHTASDEVLVIRRLGGVLPRKESPDDLRGADGEPLPMIRMSWKDFDLRAARLEDDVIGSTTTTWVVLVPTAPEAIRVTFSGESARSEELKRRLQEFLTTLDGKSNWLSDQEWRDRITKPIGMIFIVAVVAVLVYLRNRRSRSPISKGDGRDAANDSTQ